MLQQTRIPMSTKKKSIPVITLDQIDFDSVNRPIEESYQDKLQRKLIKKKYATRNNKRATDRKG